jgi:hypothetical protein
MLRNLIPIWTKQNLAFASRVAVSMQRECAEKGYEVRKQYLRCMLESEVLEPSMLYGRPRYEQHMKEVVRSRCTEARRRLMRNMRPGGTLNGAVVDIPDIASQLIETTQMHGMRFAGDHMGTEQLLDEE